MREDDLRFCSGSIGEGGKSGQGRWVAAERYACVSKCTRYFRPFSTEQTLVHHERLERVTCSGVRDLFSYISYEGELHSDKTNLRVNDDMTCLLYICLLVEICHTDSVCMAHDWYPRRVLNITDQRIASSWYHEVDVLFLL